MQRPVMIHGDLQRRSSVTSMEQPPAAKAVRPEPRRTASGCADLGAQGQGLHYPVRLPQGSGPLAANAVPLSAGGVLPVGPHRRRTIVTEHPPTRFVTALPSTCTNCFRAYSAIAGFVVRTLRDTAPWHCAAASISKSRSREPMPRPRNSPATAMASSGVSPSTAAKPLSPGGHTRSRAYHPGPRKGPEPEVPRPPPVGHVARQEGVGLHGLDGRLHGGKAQHVPQALVVLGQQRAKGGHCRVDGVGAVHGSLTGCVWQRTAGAGHNDGGAGDCD